MVLMWTLQPHGLVITEWTGSEATSGGSFQTLWFQCQSGVNVFWLSKIWFCSSNNAAGLQQRTAFVIVGCGGVIVSVGQIKPNGCYQHLDRKVEQAVLGLQSPPCREDVLKRFQLAEIFIFKCFSYTIVFFVSLVYMQQCKVFLIADSHFSVIAFVKLLCFLLMLLEKYCCTPETFLV